MLDVFSSQSCLQTVGFQKRKYPSSSSEGLGIFPQTLGPQVSKSSPSLPRNSFFPHRVLAGWFVFLRQGELCGRVRTESLFYENEFYCLFEVFPSWLQGLLCISWKGKKLYWATYSTRKLYCTSLLIFKYVHKKQRHTLAVMDLHFLARLWEISSLHKQL